VILAPSRHFARVLVERGVSDRNGGKPVIVPTGVDDDVIATVVKPRSTEGAAARVVWVGRFSAEKRPVEFCEALAHVKRDSLGVLVGSGTLRAEAERIAPTGTVFTGPLAYADALREIAGADVLVQSSYGFETQGMTVTEALALGTAVVVVDPDIANELPADRVTVSVDLSPAALAAAIESAIDESRRNNAHTPLNSANFMQSSLTAQTIDLYDSLITR